MGRGLAQQRVLRSSGGTSSAKDAVFFKMNLGRGLAQQRVLHSRGDTSSAKDSFFN